MLRRQVRRSREAEARLGRAGRPVLEAIERRVLLSGAPAQALFQFSGDPANAGVRFEESAELGDKLFLSGRKDYAAETLYAATGNGDVVPLFTGNSSQVAVPNGGISALTPFNGKLYFFAGTLTGGFKGALYSTDGTPAGTQLVKVISTTESEGLPLQLSVLNGKLAFLANAFGQPQLWTSDGTPAGTNLQWFAPAGVVGATYNNVVVDNYLFFATSSNKLWRTDGTAGGTQPVFQGTAEIDLPCLRRGWGLPPVRCPGHQPRPDEDLRRQPRRHGDDQARDPLAGRWS
jgi:ELWxxDGT repeat protein